MVTDQITRSLDPSFPHSLHSDSTFGAATLYHRSSYRYPSICSIYLFIFLARSSLSYPLIVNHMHPKVKKVICHLLQINYTDMLTSNEANLAISPFYAYLISMHLSTPEVHTDNVMKSVGGFVLRCSRFPLASFRHLFNNLGTEVSSRVVQRLILLGSS